MQQTIAEKTDPNDDAPKRPLMMIGVCTRNRSVPLDRLLASFAKLHMPLRHDLALVIIENDQTNSADAIVAKHTFDFPVSVVLEPAVGISNARNKMLDEADTRNAAFLLSVDDDEIVVPGWARAYEDGFERLPHCSALMGWVDYAYEGKKSHWVTPQNYGRQIFGQRRRVQSTTNYALRRSVFATSGDFGMRFDPKFNASGSGDTEFLLRLIRKNGMISGTVPRARSIEYLTPERASLWWTLKRAWNQNIVYFGIIRELHRKPNGKIANRAYRQIFKQSFTFIGRAIGHLLMIFQGEGPVLRRMQKKFGLFLYDLVRASAVVGFLLGAKSVAYQEPKTVVASQ